ncbi:MAG: GGDEF domain-containing protein [Burkholderiales bacterium]
MSLLRGVAAFAVPVAILAVAYALGTHAATLPPAYASLAVYAPEAVLAVGGLLAAGFQRGRIFFALLTLAMAYFAARGYLSRGAAGFPARAVFASLCLWVPLNLMALALVRERGIFNLHGLLRAAIIALECAGTAWLIASGNREMVDWLYQPLTTVLPPSLRMPQAGLILMMAGAVTAVVLWWRSRSAIDLAFAGAIVAWSIAAQGLLQREWHAMFTAAAAVILVVAVLQDVYRMAFRDELTGVPGRRALNEHLARLGRRFAIAVIDIDHFKKFNDTHGHDVGDQVLKMVATRIERVQGGGSAYRFGGEEFVIVFPGATVAQAIPLLDALRVDVAKHGLTLRASDRPSKTLPRANVPARKPRAGGKKLSVTISIGVAERNENRASPSDVLAAADKALYRAKRTGRNRVSR